MPICYNINMKYDLNNLEYLDELKEAGNSKAGKIIVDFIKAELDKVNLDSINEEKTAEEIGIDYKSIKATKEYLKKCLSYLI